MWIGFTHQNVITARRHRFVAADLSINENFPYKFISISCVCFGLTWQLYKERETTNANWGELTSSFTYIFIHTILYVTPNTCVYKYDGNDNRLKSPMNANTWKKMLESKVTHTHTNMLHTLMNYTYPLYPQHTPASTTISNIQPNYGECLRAKYEAL